MPSRANHAPRRALVRAWAASALAVVCLAACGGGAEGGDPAPDLDRYVPAPGHAAKLEIDAIDEIDVLFVIDRSASMREEQQALTEQFPGLARALATGDIDADGQADFPPPSDVQFGVISSDLGLFGIPDLEGCSGLGDDGLLAVPSRTVASGCPSPLPRFLSYRSGQDDVDQVAREFACLAALGTGGCGFEQPLEAALKALWPSGDGRVSFIGGAPGSGTTGHGDGANAGFSRAGSGGVPSLLVIVTITDENDCSAFDNSLFVPAHFLAPDDPRATQDLNLRCFHNPHLLYPIDRYLNGLRALRPGAEQLVMFTAITGVPDDDATSPPDFTDERARETFYETLLDHPRMQEQLDPLRTPEQGGNLLPVCETDSARAYPSRRIVHLARGFGENGTVQSICRRDFASVLSFILERIAHRMRNPS